MKKIFSIIAIAVTLVYVVYMVGINNGTEIKNAANNNRKEEIEYLDESDDIEELW